MIITDIISKSNLFDKLVIINLSLVGLIIWLTINKSPLVSGVFYCTFFILTLCLFTRPFFIRRGIAPLVALMAILCFVNVCISSILGGASLNFNYLVNYFAFVYLLFYIMLMVSYKPTYSIGVAILWVEIGVSAIYAISFYVFHAVTFDYFEQFTMNFSNQNLLAMFLYQSVLSCFVSFFIMKKFWIKTLCLIIGLADFSLMLMSDSRNCIISFGMVVLATIYFNIRKKYTISSWILMIVASFPIIFVWFYLSFIKLFQFQDDTLLNHEGKSAMSRFEIWNDIFKHLDGINFLFGNYPTLQGNAHNSHLSILASFGLLIAILFVYFLYRVMKHCSRNIFSYKQTICIVGFMGTIFNGMAEGALVCGALGLYIPACTYLCLSSVDWDAKKK